MTHSINGDLALSEDGFMEDIRLAVMEKIRGDIEISDDDNLLEMGLDSLKIMKLVSLWRKQGSKITFAELIESPRLRDWYVLLEKRKDLKEVKNKKQVFINPHEPFPLTDVQYAYWIGRNDDQPLGGVGCHAYLEFDGIGVDPEKLSFAWKIVNEHHPMLRAIFTSDGKQKISPVVTNKSLKVNDLRFDGDRLEDTLELVRQRLSHRLLEIETGEVAGLELSLLPDNKTRVHFDIDLLVGDVLSLKIILRDLSFAYLGKDLPSPKEWDFSSYLNEQANQKEFDKKRAKKYWEEKLDTLGGAPLLPLQKKPEKIKRPFFKRRTCYIEKEGYENIKKTAADYHVTPAMVLLAAYAEVLDRWSSNSKFLINIPLFDRQGYEKGIEDVVADFTNLLLLSIDLGKEEKFIERVKAIQKTFHKDVANSAYSGIKVQRDLAKINKGEHMSAPIVFASNIGSDFISKESLNTLGSFEYMISQTPQVWLDFQLYEIDGGLLLTWDSVDELFPQGLIDEMFSSFSNFIKELSLAKGDWDYYPDLLPPSQIKRRNKDLDFIIPKIDELIHTSFFEFAKKNFNKTALIDSGLNKEISFGNLRDYALRVAGFLIDKDLKPGDAVGVMLGRGIDQIAAVLGILAAGGVYVPINIEQPKQRCSYIFEKASIKHLITDKERKPVFRDLHDLEAFEIKETTEFEPLKEPVNVSPNDLAYIIFTSGSTGKPKGVEISHGAALNTINELNKKYGVGPDHRAIALSSLQFDLSVYDIFGILGCGGSLVLISEDKKRDADLWIKLIYEFNVNIWNSVPAFLEMLIICAESEGIKNLPLKLVMLSGDWIGLDLPHRLEELTNNCRLVAMGGATEVSIWSNFFDVKTPIPHNWKSIPYGRPLPNQVYRVVDDKGRDCPDWVSGELWIGGAGVSLGYSGDKDLSNKQFVKLNGKNWFKTGDLGRIWPDDNIEFLGREDFQVKIMGHRIELGEIEEVIKSKPFIKEAITTATEDESGSKHLVGYIVREKEDDSTKDYFEAFGENENILLDPVKRLEFKMEKSGVRKKNDYASYIKLPFKKADQELIKSYSKRMSYREFENERIDLDDFFAFLSTLSAMEASGYPFPKYRYGSAGGLYPVQVYIYIKDEKVGRMAKGLYYFNPIENYLELISDENIDGSIVSGSNGDIFNESGFSIFLVADYDAITPIYGDRARDFCLIESGLMAQLLETSSFLNNIGLCQIGVIDFSLIEHMFKLNENQECLLTLFGGKIIQEKGWTFLDEASKNYVSKIKNEDNEDLFINDLREDIKKRLPSYMVPSYFVVLDELPLSLNGKVDRKSLPKPDEFLKGSNIDFTPPKTKTEKDLVKIWQEVLGKENIGIKDNFFELGGDSLIAVQLIVGIRKVFNADLAIGKLFELPEIKSLASYIQSISGKDENIKTIDAELPSIVPDVNSRFKPFPLTDIQQAYWIGRKGDFELGNVSTHFYIELESIDLDIEALNLAWNKVINRHEMLRAVVLPDGSQKILEKVPQYNFNFIDIRDKSEKDRDEILNIIREELSHQVLSAEEWPLFDIRVTLFKDSLYRLHISFDAQMIDAWSFFSLISDWYQLYISGDDLNTIELSFRDYVFSEKEIIGSSFYERDKQYWLNRLKTLPFAPELPLVKNPSEIKNPRFNRRSFSMDTGEWNRLKAYAAKRDITPAVMLLTIYANVLSLWSKNQKFSINLTLFNRLPMHPQVNEIAGDFTSLTLLEVDGSDNGEVFSKRALKLQKQLWEDLDHRYFSGVEVLREMARQSGEFKRSQMPVVFTSALNIDSLGRDISGFNKFGKWVYGVSQTPQVWLDQQVYEQDGELILIWDAVEELFPEGLLDDMFGSYKEILIALCCEEDKWNETCTPIIPDYQISQIEEVNNTDSFISNEMLHFGFYKNAKIYPDKIAVVSGENRFTYKEIYQLSTSTANRLIENKIGKGSIVAIVMEKGYEQVAAALGILYSGAAYLPVDSSIPEARRFHILKEAGVEIVLTQSNLEKNLVWSDDLTLISIDLISPENSKIKEPFIESRPDDLAYIIYTSGSTGLPKGVMINHKGAINTIIDINKKFNISSDDNVLALSQLNFDLSVYDIFGVLGAGGTIVIPDSDKVQNPQHWLKLLKDNNISIWNSVPALMQMLIEYIELEDDYEDFDILKIVMLSGDWIPLDLPEKIKRYFSNSNLYSLGGATEASIWSNYYPVDKVDPSWKSIPYGKALCNQQLYVFDKFMNHCPEWVTGDLYIGGSGLAFGYYKDKEKTDKSFIIHPKTGQRLYKTGDLARHLPCGNIEFIGRDDSQIKIRGFRIELGEIESVLMQSELVQKAVVTAVGESSNSLGAAIVLNEDISLDKKEVMEKVEAFINSRLSSYMIPSKIILMDSFPLNQNGKIDRKSIKKSLDEIKNRDVYEAPIGHLEKEIEKIWLEILEIEKISRFDDFFQNGGDSLKAARMIRLLVREGLAPEDMSIRILFANSTIEKLSKQILKDLDEEKNIKESEEDKLEEGVI